MPWHVSVECTGCCLCINVRNPDGVRRGTSCDSAEEARNRLKAMARIMISAGQGALVVDSAIPCESACASTKSRKCSFRHHDAPPHRMAMSEQQPRITGT